MKYLVSNSSDRNITILGRFRTDIPAFCTGVEMDLSEGAASRLARVYPVLKFEKKNTVLAIEGEKKSFEDFSNEAKIRGLGTSRVVVLFGGQRFKVNAQNTEEALKAAYEQYCQ